MVDHLAKPFAMVAALTAVLYYFKNLIVRLRFSNTRQVLHFCMWNFIQENKANWACREAKSRIGVLLVQVPTQIYLICSANFKKKLMVEILKSHFLVKKV